jgi:predicted nucleotidyltransferase
MQEITYLTIRRHALVKTLAEVQQILRTRVPELRDRFKVKTIAVFGSYVRDEQTKDSDVDILVEYSVPVSLFDVVDTELFLGEILGAKVDLILKKSVHPEIREQVLREAVPV